jgi:CubicO group peptidase (beta-lactamase class C family)
MPEIDDVERAIRDVAERTHFAGVVDVALADGSTFAAAFGLADRPHRIPNTPTTRFGIASGTKGLTALTVVSLIQDGALGFDTTARSVLGDDLPLITDDVTIEHLLAHRSGIGDYLDESAGFDVHDYVMSVPVHELATTEAYLRVLDGHATAFPADGRFAYCNGGYVVLALIAERATATPFHDLVHRRVCEPARMRDTAFLRSDELPERTAVGYLDDVGLRTNVLHLPVRGSGDGGISTTIADVRSLWSSLFDGRIVPKERVSEMVRPRSVDERDGSRYGLGFWLDADGPGVALEGSDAGVSFRSRHDPTSGVTTTVISNTSEGAWPVADLLERDVR